MCTASILEPAQDNDTVVRFSAGLVAGVAFEAEIWRVREPAALRIKVAYPDRRVHALLPPRDHLRPLDHTNTSKYLLYWIRIFYKSFNWLTAT